MTTVQRQCGWRSAGEPRRAVDGPHLGARVGGDGGGVEGGVLDVVAHRHHVVLAHRLDVHERAAVVEVELAVPRVVHGVAEVHELRRGADVELQALEDRDDVAATLDLGRVAEGALHAAGVDGGGAGPLLDGDLRHLLTAEGGDAPGHAGAVDELADQQQLGHERRRARSGSSWRSGSWSAPRQPVTPSERLSTVLTERCCAASTWTRRTWWSPWSGPSRPRSTTCGTPAPRPSAWPVGSSP